jgi:hypothetical protein
VLDGGDDCACIIASTGQSGCSCTIEAGAATVNCTGKGGPSGDAALDVSADVENDAPPDASFDAAGE